jgi:cbb3-type cytochrome oxidase maturation protein
MEVIYTLIPGMIMLGLLLVGVLIWAVKKGQYEDFEGDGQRILMDDDEPATKNDTINARKVSVGKNFPDADD